MKRFMAANEKKKVQATPEVVKLWGTSSGRILLQATFAEIAESPCDLKNILF